MSIENCTNISLFICKHLLQAIILVHNSCKSWFMYIILQLYNSQKVSTSGNLNILNQSWQNPKGPNLGLRPLKGLKFSSNYTYLSLQKASYNKFIHVKLWEFYTPTACWCIHITIHSPSYTVIYIIIIESKLVRILIEIVLEMLYLQNWLNCTFILLSYNMESEIFLALSWIRNTSFLLLFASANGHHEASSQTPRRCRLGHLYWMSWL